MGNSKRKIGAALVLAVILIPLIYWAGPKFMNATRLTLLLKAPSDKKFMDAWADDIQRLDRAKSLPVGFHDLRKVKISCSSDHLLKIYKKYSLPLPTKPNGKFILEIFADTIDGGGVMVQYDLVDAKSGNTVWELGRTFPHNLEANK